jgi:hypothetical protein
MVGLGGLEPPTPALSEPYSNQLSYKPIMAERTGLEPVTTGVTGRHSNQLNYRSLFGGEGRIRTYSAEAGDLQSLGFSQTQPLLGHPDQIWYTGLQPAT